MNPVVATLLKIVDCLTEQRIEYAVMGGLAVRAYAIPRPTNDVDLTIALSRESLPNWFEQLESRGVTVPETNRSGWVDSNGRNAQSQISLRKHVDYGPSKSE